MKHYYSHIDDNKNLIITEVTEEDIITDSIKLHDASILDVRRCFSQIFDAEEDLYKFIQSKNKQSEQSYNLYFNPLGYEIIDEHFIKFYYESIVSNS